MLSVQENTDIADIIEILRPLVGVTKELNAQKYLAPSMVIPIILLLQKNIKEIEST